MVKGVKAGVGCRIDNSRDPRYEEEYKREAEALQLPG